MVRALYGSTFHLVYHIFTVPLVPLDTQILIIVLQAHSMQDSDVLRGFLAWEQWAVSHSQACSRLGRLICVRHSVMFAPRRDRLMMHFPEHIPATE